MSTSGITILNTEYSPRLRSLYDRVIEAFKRAIQVVEITGHADNSIEVRSDKIIVQLKRGSTEDNVAHELMHAMLQAEGYPQAFFIGGIPLAQRLHALIAADFDHLIINQRLLALGYDARAGFLTKADSYENVLHLTAPKNPDAQAILVIGMLHELIKFHYYIEQAGAQEAILRQFPQVNRYWQGLSRAIGALPANPVPMDIWRIATEFVNIADQVCKDRYAGFRFSELIGFVPVPLTRADLEVRANQVFRQQHVSLDGDQVLLRTHVITGGIMVSALVLPAAHLDEVRQELTLPTKAFADKRRIRILPVD